MKYGNGYQMAVDSEIQGQIHFNMDARLVKLTNTHAGYTHVSSS